MPINRVKDRSGCNRFEFEFSRRVNGRRQRTRKLLPASWSRARAEAYDRKECARLYALLTGVEEAEYTIDQAVARYLDERAIELKHGKGLAQELALMVPDFTGKPLAALPDVCAAYLKANRSTLAPATIRNRLRYLTAACRWGWKKHGMGQADPAARVVMPAVSNERQVYIERRDMVRLARACRHFAVRALIRIAFYSGMRLGEIVAAEVEGESWVLSDTKSGEPRIVPMHPKVRVCSDYEWPTRYITGYWFRDARAAVQLDHLHFHDLRHSAASEMVNAGVELFTVGKVLGHKDPRSTARYSHHKAGALAGAVGKIGKRA